MSRAELESVLDFIMNRSTEAEFEVLRKACERRLHDRGAFSALGSSSSTVLARNLAKDVEGMVGGSLDSVRTMTRNFISELVRKEAPGIGGKELESLLDACLPPPGAGKVPEAPPIPPAMLLAMARDFVSYSEGSMAPSRQKELWDEMPRWQDEYWRAFPGELKAIIKAYVEGRIDAETFTTALLSLLGL